MFHKKIAYDLRVWHDLDPRFLGLDQGHLQKSASFMSGPNHFLEKYLKFLLCYFTQRLIITWGCVITLTQVIRVTSRSLEGKSNIRVWSIFFHRETLEVSFLNKDCIWPKNLSWILLRVSCSSSRSNPVCAIPFKDTLKKIRR